MSGRYIAENVKKRLYSESMGRCMNPECQHNLFSENGDILETVSYTHLTLPTRSDV